MVQWWFNDGDLWWVANGYNDGHLGGWCCENVAKTWLGVRLLTPCNPIFTSRMQVGNWKIWWWMMVNRAEIRQMIFSYSRVVPIPWASLEIPRHLHLTYIWNKLWWLVDVSGFEPFFECSLVFGSVGWLANIVQKGWNLTSKGSCPVGRPNVGLPTETFASSISSSSVCVKQWSKWVTRWLTMSHNFVNSGQELLMTFVSECSSLFLLPKCEELVFILNKRLINSDDNNG